MILVAVVGVVWMWMPLRLMALRLHDLNRSAKWLLALLAMPGLSFDFGPPPGANTTLVKAGAALFLAFMVLGLVGNIKLMRSGKLPSMLSSVPAQGQRGSPH